MGIGAVGTSRGVLRRRYRSRRRPAPRRCGCWTRAAWHGRLPPPLAAFRAVPCRRCPLRPPARSAREARRARASARPRRFPAVAAGVRRGLPSLPPCDRRSSHRLRADPPSGPAWMRSLQKGFRSRARRAGPGLMSRTTTRGPVFEGKHMAVAGEIQCKGAAVRVSSQRSEAGAGNALPDAGQVVARLRLRKGGKAVAGRCPAQRPALWRGKLDHQPGEVAMFSRKHPRGLGCCRHRERKEEKQQADHAASCFRLRMASSRSPKPGRT